MDTIADVAVQLGVEMQDVISQLGDSAAAVPPPGGIGEVRADQTGDVSNPRVAHSGNFISHTDPRVSRRI
jgi:hypothetical protein